MNKMYKNSRPWWNKDCETARIKFNKARKKSGSNVTTQERKICNKKHKKQIESAVAKYQKKLHRNLLNIKNKNPKEY